MVSQQLLYPLGVEATVRFTYCLDRQLECIVTKYICVKESCHSESESAKWTLVLAGGISLLQDTWIPLMKELFNCTPAKIKSIWAIERPNHGEVALLNAKTLKEHYSVRFPGLQYAYAIHTFLTSDILSSFERQHLIGIGHSGGAGALIQGLEYGVLAGHVIPLKALIMLESPLVGPEAWPFFEELYRGVRKSNAQRPTSWVSEADAMAWFKTHFPWKTFEDEVLRIIEDTYFIPDADRPGYITTKTTVEQETACFIDDGTQLNAYPFLKTVLDILPTHIVVGSVQDIWVAGMYPLIEENTESLRLQLASVTTIQGVGHYVGFFRILKCTKNRLRAMYVQLPVVQPQEIARRIAQIIQDPGSLARPRL
ncbi:Alpha/beta-hydrolase [Favolaschia claudopus]|uniref:Alpha/beta-hydrolase n=1 Tax=Favolaschia claudopus TaxID=2862362 RepID=A0AAW0E766_9AGAR